MSTSQESQVSAGEKILKEWKTAFDAADPQALVSLYASDAFFEVSDLSIQAYGRTSILEALREIMKDASNLEIRWRDPVVGEGIIGAEYEISSGRLQGRGVAIIGIFGNAIAFDKRFVASGR
jgi:hypothetical protein